MKMALVIIYFSYFGLAWPVYVSKRTRGGIALGCIAAPWVAFWCGWFAR